MKIMDLATLKRCIKRGNFIKLVKSNKINNYMLIRRVTKGIKLNKCMLNHNISIL